MRSVMSHAFSMIPNVQVQRSAFNRSHGFKTTFDEAYLIPVLVDEVLPGDTFNVRMTTLCRMATPIVPVMDNIFLDSFFFFVPYRLVWDNWVKMMGEQTDPGDSTQFTVPVMDITKAPLNAGGYPVGDLSDYFGLPTEIKEFEHSCLPHRAYNLIYNEWFRDENLINSLPYGAVTNRDDGPDDPADYELQKRGKRHDYFTSCLPWPQKSDLYTNGVTMPLGTTAPIVGYNMDFDAVGDNANRAQVRKSTGELRQLLYNGAAPGVDSIYGGNSSDGTGELMADLTNATAATINSLRQAFQLQKMYERDARGGTRYVEIIRSHFGVTSPDARLQRPEYLGGGSTRINIHPVANTTAIKAADAPGAADIFSGQLAGFAVSANSGNGFVKSFTEHGVIIGLVSVRADLTYQQGLNRMWSRQTRFDFYWPALAHIGEQAVLNKEIYCQGSVGGTDDDDVFGYQERYAEYRYKPSQITGAYRSTFATSLDIWHLSQEFGALPALDQTFIEEAAPISRVVATPSQHHFLMDCYFDMKCVRPMPVYSVPGLIDHF